jgi:hypothetical protein
MARTAAVLRAESGPGDNRRCVGRDKRSRHLKGRRVEAVGSALKSDEEWQLLQRGAEEEEGSEGREEGTGSSVA